MITKLTIDITLKDSTGNVSLYETNSSESILSKIDGIVEAGPITTEMLCNELDATKAEIVSQVNDIKDRKYTSFTN